MRVGPKEVELFGGSPLLELLVLNGAVYLIRKCLQLVGRRLEIHPEDCARLLVCGKRVTDVRDVMNALHSAARKFSRCLKTEKLSGKKEWPRDDIPRMGDGVFFGVGVADFCLCRFPVCEIFRRPFGRGGISEAEKSLVGAQSQNFISAVIAVHDPQTAHVLEPQENRGSFTASNSEELRHALYFLHPTKFIEHDPGVRLVNVGSRLEFVGNHPKEERVEWRERLKILRSVSEQKDPMTVLGEGSGKPIGD